MGGSLVMPMIRTTHVVHAMERVSDQYRRANEDGR